MQPTPAPLLAPTAALLRGFVFEEPQAANVQAAREARGREQAQGAVLLREGFCVGPLRLAMRYEDGNELTELPPVHALPLAPAWFRGMANLHGALVPVFDAAGLLGVARLADAKPMLLVIGHGEARAGLVIDGLPQRLRFRAADRIDDAAVTASLAGCVDSAYWCDGEDWLDLDVAALLGRLVNELTGAT